MYQGHLPNGDAVQRHSAGDCYPFVIMQKGLAPDERYGIMYGGKVYEVADSFSETCQIALRIKENTAPCWYANALENYSVAFEYQKKRTENPAADVHGADFDTQAIQAIFAGDEEPTVRDVIYEYIEAGAFLEEEVGERMIKLSVHDNGMFLKDFRDDRFIFEIYPSMNTAGTVAQIMWRLQQDYVCNFAEWRGVVGAWLLHRGESVMNWQTLAFDTWQSAAYHEVKSWQDLCALLNAVTSKD